MPLDQRPLASKRAAECGTAGLQQSVIREIVLDEAAITLFAGSDEVPFLYGDYNYETIDDTDCLPAVAQYLVQHLLGYYNITRTFYSVPKHNGRSVTEKTRQVFIKRHHEDTPLRPPSPPKSKTVFKPKTRSAVHFEPRGVFSVGASIARPQEVCVSGSLRVDDEHRPLQP